MIDGETIGQLGVGALFILQWFINHRGGKRKDATLGERFDQLNASLDQRFNGVSRELFELRTFIVGPDGENGIRGDVRELKRRQDEFEERERERLERKAFPLDRRSGT